jgi:ATP-binding protein involved in chromosome partitioning
MDQQKIVSHQVQQGLRGIPGVKNIIAIASGKGGVGKSTVCANLAGALHLQGYKVGILDADIYGPSQPEIMGAYEKPEVLENKKMKPVVRHNIPTMSIGYLVDVNTPMIWRGPMVSTALQQLLNDTVWEELDILLIDLPPGTGDIQLTLCQKIPLSGAVIVTTPQDLSLIDARRAISMFNKVKVPILGLIENMSIYHCPECGHRDAIFGEGAADFIAEHDHVAVLGRLPLEKKIREDADSGCPTVLKDKDSEITRTYLSIAEKLIECLRQCPKNYAAKFPNIVVE